MSSVTKWWRTCLLASAQEDLRAGYFCHKPDWLDLGHFMSSITEWLQGIRELEKKLSFFFSFFFFSINGQADLQPALKSSHPCIFYYHLVINVHWRLILTILTFPLDESFPQSFNNFYKIFCNNYLVLSCNSPSSKNCFIHLFKLLCYRKGLKGFPPSNNNLEYFFGFPFIMHPLKSQAKVRYLFENTPNSICRVITIHPRRQHRCYFW